MENFPFLISHFSFLIEDARGEISAFLPPAPAFCRLLSASCFLPTAFCSSGPMKPKSKLIIDSDQLRPAIGKKTTFAQKRR